MAPPPTTIRPTLAVMLVLGLLGLGCEGEGPTPPPITEQPRELLFGAWATKDPQRLERFFQQWQERSVPLGESELAAEPEWVRAVYAIFPEFYDPMHLDRYGAPDRPPEVGPGYYTGVQYVVVQGAIDAQLPPSTDVLTIADFRPRVGVPATGVLFLTPEYRQLLLEFLDFANGFDEVQRRWAFIRPYIRVAPGHWGGWQLETHPMADRVALGPDAAQATVSFRIRYEGGEATLEKRGGIWLLTESHLTWIE